MIEKMKKVCIVSSEQNKVGMLTQIRNLGVVHIAEKKSADSQVLEKLSQLSKIQLLLSEYPESGKEEKVLTQTQFDKLNSSVLKAVDDKKSLFDSRAKYTVLAESVKAWGNFEPSEVVALKDAGIELHFYRMGKKEFSALADNSQVKFIKLASVEKMETVAVIGSALDKSYSATEFELPEEGYSELCKKIDECDAKLKECEEILKKASKHLASYDSQIIKAKNEVSFSSADSTTSSEDGLVWIEGYIPESDEAMFKKTAKKDSWAFIISEPEDDDEHVPTKVRYTKITSLMKPVFGILGTVPGYHEYDISFWFLCFFALFFAMIIGDAGYGFIFLGCAVALHVKQKKTSDAVLLLYVLSIANVIWGAVTGTWFGLESAMDVPFLKAMVIPAIANYPEKFGMNAMTAQNNIMQFCFIIGTVQLSLACILNIKNKIHGKDLSFVADIGWLCAINALYYIVLLLVLGAEVNVARAFIFVIAGFLLVVVFGCMGPGVSFSQGLKAGLGNAFTTFLNTISAFGNVMSYIRLFAVGMASLAIAQSFNSMSDGFTGILKVAGIIIFIIGHALNLVMGLLSVVVHGVRLNLLEFSGQLGMEWSGVAYEPFSKINK